MHFSLPCSISHSLAQVGLGKKTASISSTDTSNGDSRIDVIHTQESVVVCFDLPDVSIEKDSRDLVLSHLTQTLQVIWLLLRGHLVKTFTEKCICCYSLEQWITVGTSKV